MSVATNSVYDASRQRTIESFRLSLAAAGYRVYLLSDDDVWSWIQSLVNQPSAPRLTRGEIEGAAKMLARLCEGA